MNQAGATGKGIVHTPRQAVFSLSRLLVPPCAVFLRPNGPGDLYRTGLRETNCGAERRPNRHPWRNHFAIDNTELDQLLSSPQRVVGLSEEAAIYARNGTVFLCPLMDRLRIAHQIVA